jgi:hypothetical protein
MKPTDQGINLVNPCDFLAMAYDVLYSPMPATSNDD